MDVPKPALLVSSMLQHAGGGAPIVEKVINPLLATEASFYKNTAAAASFKAPAFPSDVCAPATLGRQRWNPLNVP